MAEKEDVKMNQDTRKDLMELHQAMMAYFARLLRNGEGKPMKASQLNVARQFLKDNGISIDKLEEDAVEMQLESLEQLELPFK